MTDPGHPARALPPELLALAPREAWMRGVLVVAAHPDDETIGAGGILPCLPDVFVAHLTDGAPEDRRWWGDPSLASRAVYAGVRRAELDGALALAGVAPGRRRALGHADQRASANLAALAAEVAALLDEVRPGVVLTHPYEGGHPDHDAAAFAVHAARWSAAAAPVVLELTSYHADGDGLATGVFLPGGGTEVAVPLAAAAVDRKRRMLACFATQARTLAQFPVAETERFRAAPEYDFTRPPHAGTLHYERFDWGTTGAEWRARAAEALEALGAGAAARC